MRHRPPAFPFAVLAAGLALSGCSGPGNGVCPVAPAVKAEEIPKPPVSNEPVIWQHGRWDWNGSTYTWREGAWIPQAQGGKEWMPGFWTRNPDARTCTWIPAHWV